MSSLNIFAGLEFTKGNIESIIHPPFKTKKLSLKVLKIQLPTLRSMARFAVFGGGAVSLSFGRSRRATPPGSASRAAAARRCTGLNCREFTLRTDAISDS